MTSDSRAAWSRRVAWLALPLTASAVLAAYARLLPAGKWQGDDYLAAWFVARDGWHMLIQRLAGQSPRPVAEALTWAYLTVSNAVGLPLAGPFLLVLWLAAICGIAAAGIAGRVREPWTFALLAFALTLLLIKPGEMFYWPQGAAAYIPCWAGFAAVTVLHRADLGRHGVALMLALLVAAFSAEVGAVTVLFYAGLLAVAGPRRRLGPVLLPALGSVVVCVVVLRHRISPMGEVMQPASGLAGNWPGSLQAALPSFLQEVLGLEGWPLAAGIGVKLVLLLAVPPGVRETPRQTLLWAASLLLGAFASVALAYHQFGALCCERHATLRQGMVLLALLALAGLLGGALLPFRRIAVIAVLLGLLAARANSLSDAWHGLPEARLARWRSWQSATAPGDTMTVFLAPPSGIANSDSLPAGHYTRGDDMPFGDTPWYAWGIMARFGKHALTIEPATR